jgi:hypothetical protein
LKIKRARQRRELEAKRRVCIHARPCFVWTFYNPGPFYMGWHLYIRTAYQKWHLSRRDRWRRELILKVMQLYPCGFLPMMSMFKKWKVAFAKQYARPTQKRPQKQGMALARAIIDSTQLVDLKPIRIKNHRT